MDLVARFLIDTNIVPGCPRVTQTHSVGELIANYEPLTRSWSLSDAPKIPGYVRCY